MKNFNFTQVSFSNVRNIINNFKNINATNCYGFSVTLFKSIHHIQVNSLAKLINEAIRNSYFPDSLKFAKIVPIKFKFLSVLSLLWPFPK